LLSFRGLWTCNLRFLPMLLVYTFENGVELYSVPFSR
jgi:hypothetical protein